VNIFRHYPITLITLMGLVIGLMLLINGWRPIVDNGTWDTIIGITIGVIVILVASFVTVIVNKRYYRNNKRYYQNKRLL